MEQLDQGTVLLGFRSEKYPNIPCYGVLITASCDIANKKVDKFYYLLGINAQQWLCTEHSYRIVYNEKRGNIFGQLHQKFKKFSLNAEILQGFSIEEAERVIEQEVKGEKDRNELKKIYKDYLVFCKSGMNETERRQAVQKDIAPALKFLDKVGKGEVFHYYYLPEKAYLKKSNKMDSGLIIDLQEIGSISLEDALRIVTPGIDKLILTEVNGQERIRMEKVFWLEKEDDFVGIEGKISSPWREHLMQRFSHDFVRVGIDGAGEIDYKKLVENI